MDKTEKRSDVIADTLTIREMAAIIDGLTALSLTSYDFFSREDIWFLRRLITDAHSTAVVNEYAGDYDYPEEAS